MKKIAIIVAGGSGLRAGGDKPKQLQKLCGLPVFLHSIRTFIESDSDTKFILAINEAYRTDFKEGIKLLNKAYPLEYKIVAGGKTRAGSVLNALKTINSQENALIAVHDAARPLITSELVSACWREAESRGAVIPVVPLTDSIRHLTDDKSSVSVDRSGYVAVQTPQVFRCDILMNAYQQISEGILSEYSVTDDASVVEAAGGNISLIAGDPNNIKITGPQDLKIAELLTQLRED